MRTSRPAASLYVPAASGRCLYHCTARTRPHLLSTPRRRIGWVYACPAGTVSTAVLLGNARRPSPAAARRFLQSRLFRPERVSLRDLRAATRHGPELGLPTERALEDRPSAIRLLYWRRYPRKAGRRYSYLYACFRHGAGDVRFYAATSDRIHCPWCTARNTRS